MAYGCGYEDTINKIEPSPLKLTDPKIKELRKTKRAARKLYRQENRDGRDAVKKFNAGQDEYINASEFKASKAEGKGIKKSTIKDANEEIKNIRKKRRS